MRDAHPISLSSNAGEQVRLSAVALAGQDLSVDREAGVVKGLSVIAAGPARGHGFTVDDVMLDQVVSAINAEGSGSKSRFGHPQLLADSIGSAIGRVRNARKENGKVKADLHLFKFAASSPVGNLREYVLGMAEEDPGTAGMSISFEPAEFEQSDDGTILGRVSELVAVDLVDDPAANPGGLLHRNDPAEPAKPEPQPQPPDKRACAMNERLRKFLESIGLSVDAADDEAWVFLGKLDGDNARKAANVRAGREADDDGNSDELEAQRQEAARLERERVDGIHALAAEFGFGSEWAKPLIDGNKSLDHARAAALEKLKEARGPIDVQVGTDHNRETLASGIRDGLLLRAGVEVENPSDRATQFRGRSLLETGRMYLEQCGLSTDTLSRRELAGLLLNPVHAREFAASRGVSLNWQGIGSFTSILKDTMNKTMRRLYQEQPRTWQRWARRAVLPDFREANRVVLGEAPDLKKITPGGEVKYVKLVDSGEKYALAEYGQIVPLTRRVIINDDVDFVNRIPRLQAQASGRLEDDVAYKVLTDNANMSDGTPLFHADHGNLAGAGAAISVTSVGAMRKRMRTQKGPNNAANLAISLDLLLVPAALETVVEQFVGSTVDPAKTNNTRNPFANKPYHAEPRLDDNSVTAWYGLHTGGQVDTVEVGFLEGEEAPQFDSEESFDDGGVKMKVTHVVASKAIDHRGMQKDPGA